MITIIELFIASIKNPTTKHIAQKAVDWLNDKPHLWGCKPTVKIDGVEYGSTRGCTTLEDTNKLIECFYMYDGSIHHVMAS